jgi:4'-phosphopantetheinyl transferase
VLALEKDQLHVWYAPARPDPGTVQLLCSWLNEAERARAARYRLAAPSLRFQIARGMLRHVLSLYMGNTPDVVHFETNAHGKPRLANQQAPHFNVSHADDVVVIAVAADRSVGVDVEQISSARVDARMLSAGSNLAGTTRANNSNLTIAKHHFAEEEYEFIAGLPLSEQASTFARLWTCKEAYLKALGVGLSRPLNTFQVSFNDQHTANVVAQSQPLPEGLPTFDESSCEVAWTIHSLDIVPGYATAIAAAGVDWSVRCMRWQIAPA